MDLTPVSEAKVKTEPSNDHSQAPPEVELTTVTKDENSDIRGLNNSQCVEVVVREKLSVNDKEREKRVGIAFIEKGLLPALSRADSDLAQVANLRQQAEAILKANEPSQFHLGVVGTTGCGKSSLINALLDEGILLPTSGQRAATSIVVEISYNYRNGSLYVLEVKFLERDFWVAEVTDLLSDIKDGITTDEAWEKLSAVYPDFTVDELASTTPDKLLASRDLSEYFGQTKTISEHSAKKFHKIIKGYVDNTKDNAKTGNSALWPLLQQVKVLCKSSILKKGLVLVDLPGVGDANRRRAEIAENYLCKLDHIFVVADIVRAVDDKVAKELMANAFHSQALRNGDYAKVTFIMTKTDQINSDEIIESSALDKTFLLDIAKREENIAAGLRKAKNDLAAVKSKRKTLRKRKRQDTESASPSIGNIIDAALLQRNQEAKDEKKKAADDQAELENITIPNFEKKKVELNEVLIAACIVARNNYSEERIVEEFATSYRECLDKLIAFKEEQWATKIANGGSKVEMEKIQREKAELEREKAKIETLRAPRVFGVSSTSFQQQQGRFKTKGRVPGLPDLESTNIPPLNRFASDLTMVYREATCDTVNVMLKTLRFDLETWLNEQDESHELSETQINQLRGRFDDEHTVFAKGNITRIMNHIRQMRNIFTRKITTKVQEQQLLENVWQKIIFSPTYSAIDIKFPTFKAVCTRYGRYERKNGITFDWNKGFTEEAVLNVIGLEWHTLFSELMLVIHLKLHDTILNAFMDLEAACRKSLWSVCGKQYTPGLRVLDQVNNLKDIFFMKARDIYKNFKKASNLTHTKIKSLIARELSPGYDDALSETGKGAYARMQTALKTHVNEQICDIFMKCSELLAKEFRKISGASKVTFSNAATELEDHIKRIYEAMLANASKNGFAKVAEENAKKEILPLLERWNELRERYLDDADEQLRPADWLGETRAKITAQTNDESEYDSDGDEVSDSESDDDGNRSDSDSDSNRGDEEKEKATEANDVFNAKEEEEEEDADSLFA